MSARPAPRYQGRITSWKDEQGFGFIAPNGGGPAVFVHISAFGNRGARPANDDIVTYHLGANEKGPRAEQVVLMRAGVREQASRKRTSGALLTATLFFGFLGLCYLLEKLPLAMIGVYVLLSAVTCLVYAADKSAARQATRRTREDNLHLLALLGGWPGAMVAQQVLRHKSKKTSFRVTFWMTVIVNCAGLYWFMTPSGVHLLQTILA